MIRIIRRYLNKVFNKYEVPNIIEYVVLLIIFIALIDKTNAISKVMSSQYIRIYIIIATGLGIVFFIKLFKYGATDLMKLSIINKIDLYIVVLFGFSAFYILIKCLKIVLFIMNILVKPTIYLFFNLSIIKSYISSYVNSLVMIIFVISSILLLIRSYISIKVKKNCKKGGVKNNVFDLRDIYFNNFDKSKDIIWVDEKESEYDLLGRENTINKIYDLLIECTPKDDFVISLEGKWGSGKSTILKKVKDKFDSEKDIKIIDDFDPWIYGNEENMLYNMLDSILKSIGYKYRPSKVKKLTDSIYSAVSTKNKDIGLIKGLFFKEPSISELKKEINEYIGVSNKRFIFIIDNIERTENKNIILLFKLIHNVLNFNGVVYVLAFDNTKVKKIFDEDFHMDYSYLNKIIQTRLCMPKINSNDKIELMKTCVINILSAYGEEPEVIKYCEPVLLIIFELIENIRDFKKFINSVINSIFKKNCEKYLDERDMLVIQFLKVFEPYLYDEIYENREYYLEYEEKEDERTDKEQIKGNKFNNERVDYFEKLFKDREAEKFKKLLNLIFGNIDMDLAQLMKSANEGKEGKRIRIVSGKYFELFFCEGENKYLKNSKAVKDLVDKLKNKSNIGKYEKIIKEFIDENYRNNYNNLFQEFNKYIGEFDDEKSRIILKSLLSNWKQLFYFNNNYYCNGTIIKILNKVSDDGFNEFINNVSNEMLSEIDKHFYGYDYKGKKEVRDKLVQCIKDRVQSLMQGDIYKEKYEVGDTKILYHYIQILFEETGSNNINEELKSYMERTLSKENIFRFLLDIIEPACNKDEVYYVDKISLERITNIKLVDRIMNEIKEKDMSSYEKAIKKVYDKMRNYISENPNESYTYDKFYVKSSELANCIKDIIDDKIVI